MIKLKDGMKVSANIGDTQADDCKIRVVGEWLYLCQNKVSGGAVPDGETFGYMYTWKFKCVDGVYTDRVKNIMLHVPTLETLSVGDVLEKGKSVYTVGGVVGEICFLLNNVGHVQLTVTRGQLKAEKYRVLGPEPDEVTEEELFAELGRPVKIVNKKK